MPLEENEIPSRVWFFIKWLELGTWGDDSLLPLHLNGIFPTIWMTNQHRWSQVKNVVSHFRLPLGRKMGHKWSCLQKWGMIPLLFPSMKLPPSLSSSAPSYLSVIQPFLYAEKVQRMVGFPALSRWAPPPCSEWTEHCDVCKGNGTVQTQLM